MVSEKRLKSSARYRRLLIEPAIFIAAPLLLSYLLKFDELLQGFWLLILAETYFVGGMTMLIKLAGKVFENPVKFSDSFYSSFNTGLALFGFIIPAAILIFSLPEQLGYKIYLSNYVIISWLIVNLGLTVHFSRLFRPVAGNGFISCALAVLSLIFLQIFPVIFYLA